MGENYVRPEFVDGDVMEIEEGCHPMIQELSERPYIPNAIRMGGQDPRSKIITGPNMGGQVPHSLPSCSWVDTGTQKELMRSHYCPHCDHGANRILRPCCICEDETAGWRINKNGR